MDRAQRALREDIRLHLVAISSLTVAFLCLAATMMLVGNLDSLAERWQGTRRMTIYLEQGATRGQISELQVLLSGLSAVQSSTLVTQEEAKAQFLEAAQLEGDTGHLHDDAFPASVELTLRTDDATALEAAAQRITALSAVDEVETYSTWFGQLSTLLSSARSMALGLAVLVFVCALAVVGNTIRLSLAGRGAEIEVMKLCGATDRFVRGPFLVEGVFQGVAAALMAVVMLLIAYLLVRGELDAALASLLGGTTTFLHPFAAIAVVGLGGVAGALGSVLSLRRYLVV